MKKLVIFLALITASTVAMAQSKRVLIVSTNRDSVGTHVSGTYLPEIAYAFQYFLSRGYEVDIVTPLGGRAAIYQRDVPAELRKISTSDLFIYKTMNTLAPSKVNPNAYGAVYYPGGHGQYFDVVTDERIAFLTAAIYEQGGVLGTAGHGAASLIDVRLKNGEYLVAGKKMTCFPQWAERQWMNISNYGKLLAFDMEQVLARRGAQLTVSTFETRQLPARTLVVDSLNRIVTGSFASSAQWVAEQMCDLMDQNKNLSNNK